MLALKMCGDYIKYYKTISRSAPIYYSKGYVFVVVCWSILHNFSMSQVDSLFLYLDLMIRHTYCLKLSQRLLHSLYGYPTMKLLHYMATYAMVWQEEKSTLIY